jgi:hypothetical protein
VYGGHSCLLGLASLCYHYIPVWYFTSLFFSIVDCLFSLLLSFVPVNLPLFTVTLITYALLVIPYIYTSHTHNATLLVKHISQLWNASLTQQSFCWPTGPISVLEAPTYWVAALNLLCNLGTSGHSAKKNYLVMESHTFY